MKRTIKIFSLPKACGLGGAVRRAALMLLVTLLTTMSAWADDVWYYVNGSVDIDDRIW